MVMQPIKAPSNHKTETRQPEEPGKSLPHTKAKPDSCLQHAFDTAGVSDIEPIISSPKSVPRCKTRATIRVSTVKPPLSPITSPSPREQPRSGKPKVNNTSPSKTITLSSDNGNHAGATEVTHTRKMKHKRVVESDDESEPTAKKPKSETVAIERITPRPKGSTYKTRRNAAKANLRHKTPPTLICADDPKALEAQQVKPPATAKREPEARSAKFSIIEEKMKRQPKAYSSPQGGSNQSSASECERIFEWDCGAFA